MPAYDLYCSACKYWWEERLTFSEFDDISTKKCQCGKVGKIKTMVNDILHSSVKDVKTIGQAAEKNVKRMGKYKASEIEEKKKKAEPKGPWYGSLSSSKRKQILGADSKAAKAAATKYIMTGE